MLSVSDYVDVHAIIRLTEIKDTATADALPRTVPPAVNPSLDNVLALPAPPLPLFLKMVVVVPTSMDKLAR